MNHIIEANLNINSDNIIPLQKEGSELKQRYKYLTNIQLEFMGKKRTIAYIKGFYKNQDRSLRKLAHDTINDYFYQKQSEFDELFFKLITVRNKIAKKMEFKDYSEYSLLFQKRFDYNYDDIKKFRDNIVKYFVPLCKIIDNKQKEELGLKEFTYYDAGIYYKEMPKSKYQDRELLIEIGKIYSDIDNNLGDFYKKMLVSDCLDFEARDTKITNITITNYLTEHNMPVITGNFSQTYSNIRNVFHEFGHAYQKHYASIEDKKHIVSALLKYPTFDIAEMFSHAMELISLNHIDSLFNGNDIRKYRFNELASIIKSLPTICLVDEFQERVYKENILKKEDMRRIWLDLVCKYGLQNINNGHPNLDSGGEFYKTMHIFIEPFYYIDYALSYFGSFSIYDKCQNDLKVFESISKVASYYPLYTLIRKYHLANPFEESEIKKMAERLGKEL